MPGSETDPAWVKMLTPTPACSGLARLLDWVVVDALTTGPMLILIKVSTTSITAQHDGAAPASAASLEDTLSRCGPSSARTSHAHPTSGFSMLAAFKGGRTRATHTEEGSEQPARTRFSWEAAADDGPGAIRLADLLTSLHHIK
mmetsp:Transcript_37760/g.93744  ORF Transcript_37760/g.93744 Transcript_37760/m.93744 type:complete len:144 (+) Transcript_37760:107-538(+)